MKLPKTCPCCGQLVAPPIILPPIKQRIYDALMKRPRTAEELRTIAGSFFPDREPSHNCIYNHIRQLNEFLKSRNLVARQPVRYGAYQLEAL